MRNVSDSTLPLPSRTETYEMDVCFDLGQLVYRSVPFPVIGEGASRSVVVWVKIIGRER